MRAITPWASACCAAIAARCVHPLVPCCALAVRPGLQAVQPGRVACAFKPPPLLYFHFRHLCAPMHPPRTHMHAPPHPQSTPSHPHAPPSHPHAGFSTPIARWVTTNLRPAGSDLRWGFDLEGISEMYASYESTCMWDLLQQPPQGLRLDFVRAEGSSFRWSAAEQALIQQHGHGVHALANSGHWVHSDNPDGLFDILAPSFHTGGCGLWECLGADGGCGSACVRVAAPRLMGLVDARWGGAVHPHWRQAGPAGGLHEAVHIPQCTLAEG